MFYRNIKISLRRFGKQPMYSLINVLGLAMGLVAGIFIFMFVQHELSYDQFNDQGERIYRLTEAFKNGEEWTTTAMTPYKIAPLLAEYSPAVKSFVRFDTDIGRGDIQVIKYEENRYETSAITFADSTVFEIFSFPLVQGDPQQALSVPNAVVVAQSAAKAIFGDQDPMGKSISVTDEFTGNEFDVTVNGVMEDMPENAHIHYDFLISKATGDEQMPNRINHWGWTSQYSYILLEKGHDIGEVEKAMTDIKKEHAPDWFNKWAGFGTQPLLDIHLHSNVKDEVEANGSIWNVYIFSIIGLFILLIASINYMNLTTARAANRAREVGMRKVIGARYQQLVQQFLGESMLVTFLAFLVAITLTILLLPYFNQLTGKALTRADFWQPGLILSWTGIVALIGFLSGSYPAFFLASFQPMKVLKGFFSRNGRQTLVLRKVLVVLQFSISIALIVGIMVIYDQWEFLRNKRLGIDTEQMLMIPIRSANLLENYELFKQGSEKLPGVIGATASSKNPLSVFTNYGTFDVTTETDDYSIPGVGIAEDFAKVYDVEILNGRPFRGFAADSNAVLVNEAAVKLTGMENPIGQVLKFSENYQPTVVGVVKDFNFESLHAEIRPMYFYPTTGNLQVIALKITPENVAGTIDGLESLWSELGVEESFSFTFLDEDINRHYQSEALFLQVFTTLGIIAIFIACLGLFGLAAFTVEQRTKEIGIRKVLGANVTGLVALLSKDFLRLVLIAALVAFPIAWYAMDRWLENFAYRINIPWYVFVLAAVLAVSVAFLTVSFQSVKAALTNPVDSLKSE